MFPHSSFPVRTPWADLRAGGGVLCIMYPHSSFLATTAWADLREGCPTNVNPHSSFLATAPWADLRAGCPTNVNPHSSFLATAPWAVLNVWGWSIPYIMYPYSSFLAFVILLYFWRPSVFLRLYRTGFKF